MAHNGKNQRIAALHRQLNLPKKLPKVSIPVSLHMLQRSGINYSICTKCKEGKIEITAFYLMHNGTLVNIKDLKRSQPKKESIATNRATK